MRKKLLHLCFLFLCAINALAEGKIIIGTSVPTGESFTIRVTRADQNAKVFVDWGDGNRQEATLEGWSSVKKITGTLLNDTIHVYGDFTAIDFADSKINVLHFVDQPNLKQVEAQKNELTYEGLDFTGAPNIDNLNLNYNKVRRLDLRMLTRLNIFSINHNEELSTVLFADGCETLTNIDMSYCDISNFYPISLPNLKYLNIENGSLQILELGSNYPNLKSVNVNGNEWMTEIDVTQLPKLEKIAIGGTKIKELNLVNNPDLISIDAHHTDIANLSIEQNKMLTTLVLNNTKIGKLNVSHLQNLQNINLDSTNVARIDLSKNRYLRDVSMKNTNIQFLDMHSAVGINRLNRLNISNCKRMTPQSLNFTFMAMPDHNGASYSTNVFISGSNGETAKTELLSYDAENYYRSDIQGNGTASMDSIAIQQLPIEAGTYRLEQISADEQFNTWNSISNKAIPGFPIKISTQAPEGQEFVGVEINGELITDSIFVVSASASIRPIFTATTTSNSVVLTVAAGTPQEYFITAANDDTEISIDWGNGEPEKIKVGYDTHVKGTASGTKISIYGEIIGLDVASYPGVGYDNKIKAIDLKNCKQLKKLSTYMNFIETIDLSGLKELEELDCAYNNLTELNLDDNAKLRIVKAYGNHIERFKPTNNKQLVVLDLRKNWLEEVDLAQNALLTQLDLSENSLEELNLSNLAELEQLNVSGNHLTTLNLENAPMLSVLKASRNKFSTLQLNNNTEIKVLEADENQLSTLDLSNQKQLTNVNIGGNKFDACTLNDIYYALPVNNASGGETKTANLKVRGEKAETYNQAQTADSKIATEKGWIIDYEGDASGCEQVYITIASTENGSVEVMTANNTPVASGTKVMRNEELHINATPAAGYEFVSATANNEQIINNKFTPTRATTIVTKFSIVNGINSIHDGEQATQANSISIESVKGALQMKASTPTRVTVYQINGKVVFNGQINGVYTLTLPTGVYVVETCRTKQTMLVR